MSVENMLPQAAVVFVFVGNLMIGGFWVENRVKESPVEARPAYDDGRYPDPVRPGEDVMLNWIFNKKVDCDGQFSRVWNGENGAHIAEPFRPSTLGITGGPIPLNAPTTIPKPMPDGNLELKIHGYIECDGMKKESYHSEIMRFVVVND